MVVGAWLRSHLWAPFVAVLKQGLSVRELTLALSFGIVGALFPLPGVTSLVCLLLAWLVPYVVNVRGVVSSGANGGGKLNVAAMQIVNLLLTPLELALIVPHMSLGTWLFASVGLLGEHNPADSAVDVTTTVALLARDPMRGLATMGAALLRAAVAWAVLLPFEAFALFVLLQPVVRALLQRFASNDKL